ncbi:MAG TPA: hypothetical protein VHZ50_01195 [Puia sp.]|nr:hypothetical protein [Puia sp.]
MKTIIKIIIPCLIFLASCKKDSGGGGGSQSNGNLVRIFEGTDADVNNDTVYLLTYNSSNQLITLLDSLYQDSLVATYDASGNLSTVNDVGAFGLGNSSFTYNTNGTLAQINANVNGENDQYVFEYTNGVVSKKTYTSDFGQGGALQLWSYDVYTASNGNITDMKEYDAANNLLFETTFTYGAQANPFKTLSLFNFGDRLGTEDIMNYEIYFNKNIQTGFTTSSVNSISALTFNSQQKPTEIITTDQINGWVETWQFFYK